MSNRVVALAAAVAVAAASILASRRSTRVARETTDAVASGGTFKARLTGYWPKSARTDAERRMEGGAVDRRGKPLHTLEQHLADRAAHPYVAVSGDDEIFPYGQRISLDAWPDAVFRVVDTGGHFRGSRKVYRTLGREPLDVDVDSPRTRVPVEAVATVMRGDHFDKPGKRVAVAKFRGQDVAVGALELLGIEIEGDGGELAWRT